MKLTKTIGEPILGRITMVVLYIHQMVRVKQWSQANLMVA